MSDEEIDPGGAHGDAAAASDDEVVEVASLKPAAVAAAATAAAAVNKKKPTGATANPATVQGWTEPDTVDAATGAVTLVGLGALSQYLVGFRIAASSRERSNAVAHLALHGRVVCLRCNKDVIAKRQDVLVHLRSDVGLPTAAVHPGVAMAWAWGIKYPTAADVAAGGAAPVVSTDGLRVTINAALAAHGLSFNTITSLFAAGSPMLSALVKLPRGVGSVDTVGRDVESSLPVILRGKIRPIVRRLIDFKLPVLLALDESPGYADGGKRPIVLVSLYQPLMSRAEIIFVDCLNRAANADAVLRVMRNALQQEALCSEVEVADVLARSRCGGDHAAYMLNAAGRAAPGGAQAYVGELGHALDLVIGSLVSNLRLSALVGVLRRVFLTQSYEKLRLAEAFEKHVTRGSLKSLTTSTTRWGYNSRVLGFLSISLNVALLQQFCLFSATTLGKQGHDMTPTAGLTVEQCMALGSAVLAGTLYRDAVVGVMKLAPAAAAAVAAVGKKGKKGPVMMGAATAAFEQAKAAAAAAPPANLYDIGDVGAEEDGGASSSDDDSSDDDSGAGGAAPAAAAAPKLSKAALQRARVASVLRSLLTMLANPALRAVVRAASIVVRPLRDAQVTSQNLQARAPQVVASLTAAWHMASKYLTSEADYLAALETSLQPVKAAAEDGASVDAQLMVDVKEGADGTFTVTMPKAPLVPFVAAQLDADELEAAVKDVTERVRQPLLGMTQVWDKWVKPALALKELAAIASFDHALPEDGSTFVDYCGEPGALPPYLKFVEAGDDELEVSARGMQITRPPPQHMCHHAASSLTPLVRRSSSPRSSSWRSSTTPTSARTTSRTALWTQHLQRRRPHPATTGSACATTSPSWAK
jgi:hypothetical protein